MPDYFFALDDELPPSGASEQLPDDDAAREAATVIAAELSRNRLGREQVCVSALNIRGQVVHRAWTKSEN